ncbi:hypothetical protein CDL15_Pgr027577 [Punica granatum]|uniref:Polygalacturonase-like n=1 Tax=Punica granatum TaxID=22663 RepID=A0A218XJ39_PUNGR|nr:hypothetical protein CDL15_Pgr027577 [Punica granatum]
MTSSLVIVGRVILFLTFLALVQSSNAVYNVVSYGAKSNGRTDSALAFSKAWSAACRSTVPATIYVPRGKFLLGAIVFRGPCRSRVTFRMYGTLLASSNYWSLGNSNDWILFQYVNRLSIHGGTLNAQGATYWACRRSGKSCPTPAKTISFQRSSNVLVSGLTSFNSKMFHFFVARCTNVRIQGVRIFAPSWSPNTDGIHVQTSSGITITSSLIKTGDDCISMGPGSKNVWIDRISCGSLGQYANEEAVQNVTVRNVVFTGTQNGVRIKSWETAYPGSVTSVQFRNIIMRNVFNPIIIDQEYCPSNINCPNKSSGVKISRVTYKNIKGTSATQVAASFVCSPSNPCQGIKLRDINLSHHTRKLAVTSYCKNARGSTSGPVLPRSCLT